MHLRKKNGSACDKENDCPEIPRVEQNKLSRGIGWSPKNQRRREKSERNTGTRRDESVEQSIEPFPREGAVDAFLVTQKLLKTRIGNAFHQLLDNESRRKDETQNNSSGNSGERNDNEENEENTGSRRSSSASGRTSGNGRSVGIGRTSGNSKGSRAVAEKRKHFQEALTDLKSRLLGNGRDINLEGGSTSSFTHVRSDETPVVQPEGKILSERLLNERLFLSPQFSIGSVSNWIPKSSKARRTSTEVISQHNRRSPFRIDHFNKGSGGGLESSIVRLGKADVLEETSSPDRRGAQKTRPKLRRQQRRRNEAMRRSRSSSSLRPQRGSGFHSNLPDDLIELNTEACLLDQIRELRTSLEKSEKVLDDYLEDSKRSRARMVDQVGRLTTLYSSLSQSQDIRYKTLLDVFHENHKLLGYVESNFDYVLSVVARGKRKNLHGLLYGFLRFVAHYTMAPILGIVRFSSRIYLHLFPRRVGNG